MRLNHLAFTAIIVFGLAACGRQTVAFLDANTTVETDDRTSGNKNVEVDAVVSLYSDALDSSDESLNLTETDKNKRTDENKKKKFKRHLKKLMRLKSASDFTSGNPDKLLTLANGLFHDAAQAAEIELSDQQHANLSLVAPNFGDEVDIEALLSDSIRGGIGNLDTYMATIHLNATERISDDLLGAMVKATSGQYTEVQTMEAYARNVQTARGMASAVAYIGNLGLPDDQITSLAAAFQTSPSFSQAANSNLIDELRGNASSSTSTSVTGPGGLAGIISSIVSAVVGTETTTTGTTTAAVSPQLAIVSSAINLTVGVAMTPENPANGTFVAPTGSTCSISPALPAGLSLAADTCIISGTPTAVSASQVYIVTLTSGVLSALDSFTLTVGQNTPTFDHATTNLNMTKDSAMTAVDLTTGSFSAGTGSVTVGSWAVSPALPTGLSLSAAGVVSGTPTVVTASTSYTFTITNSAGGSATDSITIVVADDLSDDSAANFASGTMVGTEYASGKLILGTDTDCDGNTSESETIKTNCTFLDSSWTPKHSNLVAYYKFDGDYEDAVSASSLTTSGVSIDTTSPKVGSGALDLTAASFTAKIPATASGFDVEAGDFSITAWVKFQSPTGSGAKIFSYKPRASGTETALTYDPAGTGEAKLAMWDGGSKSSSNNRLPLDAWVFYSAVKSSSVINIYMNGVLHESWSSTTDYSSQFDNSDPIWIGSSHNGSDSEGIYFKGFMDEVAFWNAALTESEIQTIYQRQMATQSGTFTSRVFDAGADDDWPSVSWNTSLPFHKKLVGDIDSDDDASDEDEIATAYSGLVGAEGATSIPSNDLQTGLIAYYPMDGTVGSLAASSTVEDKAGSYDMTVVGNGVHLVDGKFGQALKLEGSTDYLQINGFLGNPSTVTIAAWFNGTGKADDHHKVVTMGDSANLGLHDDKLEGAYHHSSNWVVWDYTTRKRGAGWQHGVVVIDPTNSTQKLYLNGVEVASDTDNRAISYTYSQTTIGARDQASPDQFFIGLIDEVAFWNRALHADEVAQLYRRGANRNMIQFKQCNSSDCSDGTWQGYDGSISTWFSNSSNAAVSAPSLTFSNFGSYTANSRRYFQFRVFQESDSTSSTPDIKDFTVTP